MCLIIACEPNVRPEQSLLNLANKANDDGIGIAWTEKRAVQYVKGITLEALHRILPMIPETSYLGIHFRLATIGHECAELCHPFPTNGSLRLDGSAPSVLFHNGHREGWERDILPLLVARKRKLPKGPWSDSRAMAMAVGILGKGYLDFISGQRFAILDRNGFTLRGPGWIEEKKGMWLSNKNYLPSVTWTPSSGEYRFFGRDEDKGEENASRLREAIERRYSLDKKGTGFRSRR